MARVWEPRSALGAHLDGKHREPLGSEGSHEVMLWHLSLQAGASRILAVGDIGAVGVQRASARRRAANRVVLLLVCWAAVLASTAPARAKSAPAHIELSVAFSAAGHHVTVMGRVGAGNSVGGKSRSLWTVVLQQQLTGSRGRWVSRASNRLTAQEGAPTFALYWTAPKPASLHMVTLRVGLFDGRRLIAHSSSRLVVIRPLILIKEVLRRGSVMPPARRVASVSGDPSDGQSVVLAHGTRAPVVGGVLVLAPSAKAPQGLLGVVTRVQHLPGGAVKLTTRPGSLDEAFSVFKASVSGTLADLSAGAATGARAVAADTAKFQCDTNGALVPSFDLDLSKFNLTAELDANVVSPYFSFSILAAPELTLGLKASGTAHCVSTFARTTKKIWGPLFLSYQPIVTLDADGSATMIYTWRPFFGYEFARGRNNDHDARTFDSHGSLELFGQVHAKARLSVDVQVSVAGRAGLGGTLGPHVDATATAHLSPPPPQACLTANGAVSYDLYAFADVFVKHWTFGIKRGDFLRRQLFNGCTSTGGGGGGGGPGGGGGFEVLPIANAIAVRGGAYFSCALLRDGGVACWGPVAGDGQLGDGPFAGFGPVRVAGITNARSFGVGEDGACAVLANSNVDCWGVNFFGEVGNGTNTRAYPPAHVPGITNALAVSGGGDHTCALLSTGRVACWGRNYVGELGDGTTSGPETCFVNNNEPYACSKIPVMVSGITNATAIAAGGDHTCALLATGKVECWGEQDFERGSSVPVEVGGVAGVVALTTGYWQTCALLSNRHIACWGLGGYGGLGNGTTTGGATPVEVSGITDATEVSTGDDHTCAVLAGGSVRCWGENSFGELGDGTEAGPERCGFSTTIACSTRPVGVSGITHASGVGLGIWHSCAVLSIGSVECWGVSNGAIGEVGGPPAKNALVPVPVP
jgi:hypothetical protein